MKLLYIWIEEFRNISHQGIVVDNEYIITVNNPDTVNYNYYSPDGQRVISSGNALRLGMKVFERQIEYRKNREYHRAPSSTPISSVSALIGKNAVGKTSILECLYAQEHEYRIKDDRYYFMVFLNEHEHYIEIRSRGIHISAMQIERKSHRTHDNFEKYIIPLENSATPSPSALSDITHFFFLTQLRDAKPYVGYTVLELPMIIGDLGAFSVRNSFEGIFSFLCQFPDLGATGNKLVCYLKIDERRRDFEYFTKPKYSPEQYKQYFIYKLAQIAFSNLRKYLYHQEPIYMMDGSRMKFPNEDALIQEDRCCAELLAHFNTFYPSPDSADLVTANLNSIPKEAIEQSITFFEASTFSFSGKSAYDRYLLDLRSLFSYLFALDSERFSALYKIELPFDETYMPLVSAMQKCLNKDILGGAWTDGIHIDFEWFSSGEQQIAMLFSAIYQRMQEDFGEFSKRNVIWAIDEPEIHMHPEIGHTFVDELNRAMQQFKSKGLIESCQFFLATHSPFIVQNLSKYNSVFTLVQKEDNRICTKAFTDIPHLSLPNRTEFSFNLIMYLIFGIPTVELHNELFGELQEKTHCYNIRSHKDPKTKQDVLGIDDWFALNGMDRSYIWAEEKNGKFTKNYPVSLPTLIRNTIHHPENRSNTYSINQKDLINSIEQMLLLLY